MWILKRPNIKNCSNKHCWKIKFKQGTNEPFVVCAYCNTHEPIRWDSDVQRQSILEKFT